MRKTAGYTETVYDRNTGIAKGIIVTPILNKMQENRRNWLQHIDRMSRNRLPGKLKNNRPRE